MVQMSRQLQSPICNPGALFIFEPVILYIHSKMTDKAFKLCLKWEKLEFQEALMWAVSIF